MNRVHEASADRIYADAGGTNFAMKPGARRLDAGSAARFFYCAKASRADRNEGIGGSNTPAVETEATMRERETADWQERNGNHHPTVKPTDLMAYLCRLVTPPGGLVCDPFMGSGSTGKAAIREGFRFVGVDMTPEYVAIAKARIQFEIDCIEDAQRQTTLFPPATPVAEQTPLFGEIV
jgi:site-specific DNA-methyltransferase (adenine-specific)